MAYPYPLFPGIHIRQSLYTRELFLDTSTVYILFSRQENSNFLWNSFTLCSLKI